MTRIVSRKPLYGWGINDANYVTQPTNRSDRCPFYDRWHSMLRRCYSDNSLGRNPRYTKVHVSEEWKKFSDFLKWMEKQNWVGMCLDKDWVGDGSIYSPDSCRFIPSDINSFLMDALSSELPGSRLKFHDGRLNSYIAQSMVNGKKTHLGVFPTQYDAHLAWQKSKLLEVRRLMFVHQNIDTDVLVKMRLVEQRLHDAIESGEVTKSIHKYTM